MNMITVFTQDRCELMGCTSFVAKEGGYVRGLTEMGWVDLGKYESTEKAKLVIERIFGVLSNGGKYFQMPEIEKQIGRWV